MDEIGLVADPFKPNFDTWKGNSNLSFSPQSKEHIHYQVVKGNNSKEIISGKNQQGAEESFGQKQQGTPQGEAARKDLPIATQESSEMNRRKEENKNKALSSGIQQEASPKP